MQVAFKRNAILIANFRFLEALPTTTTAIVLERHGAIKIDSVGQTCCPCWQPPRPRVLEGQYPANSERPHTILTQHPKIDRPNLAVCIPKLEE